jgi:hypothetical protein
MRQRPLDARPRNLDPDALRPGGAMTRSRYRFGENEYAYFLT